MRIASLARTWEVMSPRTAIPIGRPGAELKREISMAESLLLKWGTLKGWNLGENQKAIDLFNRYVDIGASMSAMAQQDTPEQKQIICDLIDAVNGKIQNDWTGEVMSKEEAKQYVMEYGR